jgi:hypothetical protein
VPHPWRSGQGRDSEVVSRLEVSRRPVPASLPDWFEALNRDFRYQLTVIGEFTQAIVASEISHNQFTIRTDKPNVKVSWQVMGIRQGRLRQRPPRPGRRRQVGGAWRGSSGISLTRQVQRFRSDSILATAR